MTVGGGELPEQSPTFEERSPCMRRPGQQGGVRVSCVPGIPLHLDCLCPIKITNFGAGVSCLQASVTTSTKRGEIPKPAFAVAERWEGAGIS